VDYTIAPSLGLDADWIKALEGSSAVIHTAARVHVMRERLGDALSEYRRINVEGTLSIARQAAQAGVKRFVFLSSVKVNGEETRLGNPFTEKDTPAPKDPYGQSKLEAELGLQAIANKTGMELVILRPTMIYGPGVKGNFSQMIRIVRLGIPLPLLAVNNRRSMIGLKNCVDFIICAATHKNASGKIFLMSDGEDMSTPDLFMRVGRAMKRSTYLFSFPPWMLTLGASLLNQGKLSTRLINSLQVDIRRARTDLNWAPVRSIDDELLALIEFQRHLMAPH